MGRPPLPLGTSGKVLFATLPNGGVKARVKFRDYDGRVRLVSKVGPSRAAAERALKAELTGRPGAGWCGRDHLRDANGHLGRCACGSFSAWPVGRESSRASGVGSGVEVRGRRQVSS